MQNKMTKYYIGLAVIGLITIGLFIFTVNLGATGKQDVQTQKKVQEIETKLNSYVTKNQKIPSSLEEAGIKDVPNTITYTKNSDGLTYKFCVTFKAAKGYSTDPTDLLWGGGLKGASTTDDSSYSSYESTYQPSSLYISYYHKKGETCQTIKPYFYNYGSPTTYSGTSYTNKSTELSPADDTERKADLKSIASHLESYYADHGYYPAATDLTSSTALTTLKGIDKEALRDPKGTYYGLISTASFGKYYGYSPKASDGYSCFNSNTKYNCQDFTLTVYLSDNSLHTVKSLK